MTPATAEKLREVSDAPLLFEVAWEVCNQIGGIYTVIKTKAPSMLGLWGDNYYLIGPYNPESTAVEFEEARPKALIQRALHKLEEQGIKAHFGRWLIPGKPQVILIDFHSRFSQLANDKYYLWKDHGISTERADQTENDSIAFGFCVFEFFKAFLDGNNPHPVIGHFHEWMTGVALPRIRHAQLPMATVFTTHATLLGRYLASDSASFYREMEWINPDYAAHRYNITARYQMEKASAHSAHFFTTISQVTAHEAEKFLQRHADFILPNGLNVERFTALHEFQNMHMLFKERIHEFVMGHFFPSYTFDLEKTLYFVISGRYEYRNKGMDIFIEALYRLNQRLKTLQDSPTIVAFIVTRSHTKNINVGALQNHLMFEDLKNICNEAAAGMSKKLLSAVAQGGLPTYETLLPHDFQVRLKRVLYSRKRSFPPSIVTHDMADDANDAVLRHLRHRQLFNQKSDPVKVIFHPDFMTASNPLFNLDYDQFVRGCHLGVFPSYYEPWGYTPLECIALGLPTVTTDLSGFGDFVQHHIPQAREHGIYVLNRTTKSPDESIEDLASHLFHFCQLSRRERIELRNRAERLTEIFDWTALSAHYDKVHEAAVKMLTRQ